MPARALQQARAVASQPRRKESPPAASGAQVAEWLEGLGRLPENFNGKALVPLLENKREKIRKLAAFNLGKVGRDEFLPPLLNTAKKDESTVVRREAVAAIGRMRSAKAIPALALLAQDEDPKVALQALRGLLVFPKNKKTHEAMERLAKHPNEMIRDVIRKERTYVFDTSESRDAHVEFPDFMKNVVVHADVLDALKAVPDSSVHLTFTSPPYYNARDYSIYKSYSEYLDFLRRVFKQTLRVTKPGRFFVLNTSPIIVPRVSRQHASKRYPIPFDLHPLLDKMGWEFIDDIVWQKPEASVKNRNGGFFQTRKPLAYKPNCCTEYLMVYRKKSDRLIDWNLRQYPRETVGRSLVSGDYETSNVWRVDPTFDKTHSAVFPLGLCTRVVSYYSMADDLVFDPFGGSGTLGGAAAQLGRFFFMTEMSGEYVSRMKERFGKSAPLFCPAPRFVDVAQLRVMRKGRK